MGADGAVDGVVLVVDDDESIRETLQMALELENYATALAGDGAQALEWLRRNPTPRLILLDLMMPVMDGWQLFDQLAKDERLARIPVVVITAFERELGRVGGLPVVKKPIDLRDLLRVVGGSEQRGN
jgi:two-component system alkaline phosphatase synthesis response regulator PhoP